MELNKAKVVAIVQARYDSIRFPGKILKKINNKSILEILIKRLLKSKKISKVIVACTKSTNDKKIIQECKKLKIDFYRGSEKNVLERYFKSAKLFKAPNIVRICADCPLIDINIIDNVIENFFKKKVDYASNTLKPTFPDGLDIEIFNFKSLKEAFKKAKTNHEKEHVTEYIVRRKKFKKYNFESQKDLSNLRLTLDQEEDLKLLGKIFKYFKYDFYLSYSDILSLYKKRKNFFKINSHIKRNIGSSLNTGQKLWIRAKKIIPGGTMLFSKNPDLFLPGKWPAYFSKSKGNKIWDFDGNCFNDLCFMGVGTNTLGYSHPKIEKKVKEAIQNGNMSTLNSKEEILLAEKLVELHPWSNMARFTRSGGEANAVAARIARAATGKDNIAVCGYHGWHDWYLSSNLQNPNNLNNHLLNKLKVDGVPKSLKNTVFPFEYNNFSQLKEIVETQNIGTIKMEVVRNYEPKNNFLYKVRKLASEKNLILIFDECTSGFRKNFGGIHMDYEIYPDIAIFGKALGNGYAINAILGKREIMEASNSTFISSTFWTERIGPSAALETLKVMKEISSWKVISNIGKNVKKNWIDLAKKNSLDIKIQGIDALANFNFNSNKNLAYKTFISQEMLKKNILASNVVYTCIFHKKTLLNKYYDILDEIFKKINKCENEQENIHKLLENDICISGLRQVEKNKK